MCRRIWLGDSQLDKWQFWIDRGGTFTDVVARGPDGLLHTHKLLSENPERYSDAALQGLRNILDLDRDTPIPNDQIDAVKMGTTVATNALLERHGEPTVLVVTEGFRDALRIGYQNRPQLFSRHIVLPEQLYQHVIEAKERMDAKGNILAPLDTRALTSELERAHAAGFRSVAIVFMHAYRHPQHEHQAAEIAEHLGFHQISTSHDVSPLMKLVARGDTTVADAYLSPILRRYIDQIAQELSTCGSAQPALMFMQSHGGLVDADRFQGKDAILSGPAGGVVGMVKTGLRAGFRKLIGFDMGGTSTDVSLFDGAFERSIDNLVAGVRIRAPMMKIHTIAAGGGSLLRFREGRFQVGPESAGARPGPACYRRGGPLAVTDANVLLGRIQPDFFPAVFGPGADESLDNGSVEQHFRDLAAFIKGKTGDEMTPEQIAEGFLRIAVERMANAIKRISIQRGHDITDFVLCCFGGAAGQHACGVADALGMSKILIHPLAGVLSAYGMGLADIRVIKDAAVEKPVDDAMTDELAVGFRDLEDKARGALRIQGFPDDRIRFERAVFVRYAGTDTALEVALGQTGQIEQAFEVAHRRRFGFVDSGRTLVAERIRVEAIGASAEQPIDLHQAGNEHTPKAIAVRRVHMSGIRRDTSIYDREGLTPGQEISGPAIVIEPNATTVVEPDWNARVSEIGDLILTRVKQLRRREAIGTHADPVMLEVFNNLFMHVAEQMGVVLQNTSHSVNIKERLDFSCAVFDAAGGLVANAPHMPVHLGSMGESVEAILRLNSETMRSGDVYMLNTPYNGGTHLPDITVVTPVFDRDQIIFFVASRAHHADIGGSTPGSMPPDSQHIDEEGVMFDNCRVVHRGRFEEQELRRRLAAGRFPARNPEQNLADLKAQIAANERGLMELNKAIQHFTLDTVQAYMQHVQDNAEESVRRVIDVLKPGSFSYEMDNGAVIQVKIDIDRQTRSALIDFTGTSGQTTDNFNAPASISKAAVLYVFRTLVDTDIPLNAGCLKPLTIVIPHESLLKPIHPAAVVAGNVETSQCVTDALYAALGLLAAAQGTMNNFTFGDDKYQYYETICGGSGAGEGFDGTSAVHTHMTNSRLTDPEVLEWRFPVIVREFSIRNGSGGRGRWHGGDGAVRKIEFCANMTAAILSNHRRIAPFGMAGADSGRCGENYLVRADGTREMLGPTARVSVNPGDVFVIETPGGGGFGHSGS